MKKFALAILLALPIATAHAQESAQPSAGNDTYNFYFQKAPGPAIVNQGTQGNSDEAGNSLKSPAAPGLENSAATTTASAEKKEETELKHWAVGINYAIVRDSIHYDGQSALGFDLSYAANKYLSFGGGMLFPHKIKEKYNREIEYNRSAGAKNLAADWYVRAGVTPFHLNMFGHEFLEIGGVVGVMSTFKDDYDTLVMDTLPKKSAKLFFGPALAMNFSDSIAFQSEVHFHERQNYQALGGLRVRF